MFMHLFLLKSNGGSAHDSRVLNDALSRPHGLRVPQDKYYLVDVGYGIRNGFFPPYHEKELFNLRHFSLRTTIERGFGVLKKCFCVLDNDPFWKYRTQADVVLPCCILHNHIVGVGLEPNDTFMEEVISEEKSQNSTLMPNVQLELSKSERRAKNREWAKKRDAIAHAMFTNYTRRRTNI
ncbi:hypothetical protein ACH5RR_037066 [Cinchona calisaya]|uniref:DDE Tnp4 domain-containing protein n=1 Tax=Cinchona calisaya TaxID=153742 RepID=A0ABD2Y512_9GENT